MWIELNDCLINLDHVTAIAVEENKLVLWAIDPGQEQNMGEIRVRVLEQITCESLEVARALHGRVRALVCAPRANVGERARA